MLIIKQFGKHIFLGLLLSLVSNTINADHYPHQHEIIFAKNATKHELVEAYLGKCSENHRLAESLEEARKDGYTFKTLVKSFSVGAVSGAAAFLVIYIATR